MISLNRIAIVKPSGNTTALVFDPFDDSQHLKIASFVQDAYPSVEQVMFVKRQTDGSIMGKMAGGEFCGNAARALGFVLAAGKDIEVSFYVSGSPHLATICASKTTASLKIHMPTQIERKNFEGGRVSIAHLEGISHAVIQCDHPQFTAWKNLSARLDGQDIVKPILVQLGLSNELACGLMFVEKIHNSLNITPYVWVRDADTFFAETACSTGSMAATKILGTNSVIRQPSGEYLSVKIHLDDNFEVSGNVAVLWDGPAELYPDDISTPIKKKVFSVA